MSIQSVRQGTFDFFGDLPVVVEVSDAPLTCDAGLLPIREFDQKIGWTRRFAEQLRDRLAEGGQVDHAFLE